MVLKDKISEALKNEKCVEEISALESLNNVGEVFKKYGVELTDEEVSEFVKAAIEGKGELSPEAMDQVNGGIWGVGALIGVCKFASDYWGGPGKAVKATVNFWRGVF